MIVIECVDGSEIVDPIRHALVHPGKKIISPSSDAVMAELMLDAASVEPSHTAP